MTITAWRICKSGFARAMFTGSGARAFGGRWNSKGVAVIYTSQSLSLAAMELLVHLDEQDIQRRYLRCSIRFDESLISHVRSSDLPRNWRRDPSPSSLRQIGDEWVASARSAVLRVPSAVVPDEWNYLLNPAHPDFKQIEIGKVQLFGYDPRLA